MAKITILLPYKHYTINNFPISLVETIKLITLPLGVLINLIVSKSGS